MSKQHLGMQEYTLQCKIAHWTRVKRYTILLEM